MLRLRDRLSRRVPPLARAFGRYVSQHRDPYLLAVLALRESVDDTVDSVTADLFAEVERALEHELEAGDLELVDGADAVRFDYDTRLVLPAMLTLGRVRELAGDVPYLRQVRRVDTDLAREGERVTYEIIRALLDGDMRDAINDDEYEDFETTVRPRARAAEVAQATLEEGVESWLAAPETPDGVASAYRHAVSLSEGHQDTDEAFRDLLERHANAEGDERGRLADEIEARYKYAPPQESSPLFEEEQYVPYFTTQYERVGILYEDMLKMYEAALGVELGESFCRAIVLMVVAAQIGLDDIDDFPEDRGEQLTPVTAELALKGTAGLDDVGRLVDRYLDAAAAAAETHLTGMAIAYIREEAHDRLAALRAELD
ncbi:hypothetical protein N0B31_03800 [Salinirubellus salinus]|uniref:Uncharacterized protein n=2 Tax=Salinirubellus salinus TaxID=1364945 RepID=A0A9E7UBS3_9EURY|nr:hypothetical protein [Salinirubellus salinus]UWM55412.1 hypothetical protein N0B31_03800 [Salinirubellus salinus]